LKTSMITSRIRLAAMPRKQQGTRDPLPSPRRSRHATHHEHDADWEKGKNLS
jgi:hypothetical protein